MDNFTPTQLDWDKHLIRCWYANKFTTMKELERWFYYCWGVYPRQIADKRICSNGIYVWKFVESMPKLQKALNKYDKRHAEEIAEKLQLVKCNPKVMAKDRSKNYNESAKNKAEREYAKNVAESFKKMNRGEQWGVCK